MICSSCHFDNPPAMHFCGMCGTPLPHRPITASGAQSTLNLTRVPTEARSTRESAAAFQRGGGIALEHEPARTSSPERLSASAQSPEATTVVQGGAPSPATDVSPAKELVPDIPLDEYVRKFHYEPPGDAAEVTMRCDAPVDAPPSQPVVTPPATAVSDAPAPVVPEPVTEDVDRRLGIEPETSTEARIARPRFLDINEPQPARVEAKDDQPRTDALPPVETRSISGPSFLGLNAEPQGWVEAVGVRPHKPPRSYWRIWSALAVLLLFAWLGWLQYRSQVQQTNNGPVEIVRAKLHEWRQLAMEQVDKNLTPPPIEHPQPENQSQSQPPAPKQNAEAQGTTAQPPSSDGSHPAGQPDANAPATAPPTTQSPSTSTPTAPPETPKIATDKPAQPPVEKSQNGNSQQQADAETSQPKPVKNSAAPPAPAKSAVPGAEEMAKAKNASDSAAAAAWLWKATAKGNPDAPVQLANMYIKGDGVPRSCEQAMVLLKTAAAKENAPARNRLGSMYATGTCVPANRIEAYRWYSSSLAANPDSDWTQQTRDLIWRQMTPDERAQAQRYR